MKKTLITLAALAMASVASAASWQEVDTDVTATWKSAYGDRYYYDLTFTLSFSFSEDSLANGSSAIVAYVTDGRTAGNAVQHTYVLNRDDAGVYTMTMGRTNATDDLTSLSYSSGGNNATQSLTAGTIYTISADDTYMGSKISWTSNGVEEYNTRNYEDYVAVSTSLVSSAEEAAAATSVMLNSAFVPTTPVTPDTPAVPEPATATLSLLALAGLAARRRRK